MNQSGHPVYLFMFCIRMHMHFIMIKTEFVHLHLHIPAKTTDFLISCPTALQVTLTTLGTISKSFIGGGGELNNERSWI